MYTKFFYNKIFLISVFLESYTIYDINDCEQIVKAYYHLDNSIIYNNKLNNCIIKNYNDNKYKIIKTKKNINNITTSQNKKYLNYILVSINIVDVYVCIIHKSYYIYNNYFIYRLNSNKLYIYYKKYKKLNFNSFLIERLIY